MKVSLSWLKELVNYHLSDEQLANKLSLTSIGVKQQTPEYLELDLTYNRGDLLSLRGVAIEVAAITDSELKFDSNPADHRLNLPEVTVDLENPDLCPVYCVAKIENLKIEKSSVTWVKKLSDSGVRSINNIADVTNLIMLEFGQPMHAFDAREVKDEKIYVRCAKDEERITTLDGKTRVLEPGDLLIADSQNALGIAGVMGGKKSEISDSTNTILLEAAIFDPVANKNTAKRHGLSTEATRRFGHGLTKTNLLLALNAAIKMYEDLGGKLTAASQAGDLEDKPKTILLRQEKINSLLGVDIPASQVKSLLKSLGFTLIRQGEDWQVRVPYFRLDINIEEDLIEEVARMYGYEKITGTKLIDEKVPGLDQTLPQAIYASKLKLKEAGLTEIQTYSFYSVSVLEALALATEDKKGLIRIANPISSETEYLRTDLWPNLLEVMGKNIRQGYKDIACFEIGKVYCSNNGQPKENYRLSIALMNGSDNPLAELYQLTQTLKLPIKSIKLNGSLFHPKRQIDGLAEVHLRVLNKLGIEKRVAVLEVDLE